MGDSLIIIREELDVRLGIVSDQLVYEKDEKWLENLFYPADHSRGEDCLDNNFKPGRYSITVNPQSDTRFYLIACQGSGEEDIEKKLGSLNALEILREEVDRRSTLLKSFFSSHPELSPQSWLGWAIQGLDSFLVTRRSTGAKSIIAGYHWFGDWSRDAMISLPGLTLVTGRFEEAKEILLTFARYCREGLIPNFFPDEVGDNPLYNTVDATLWFVNAVLQYLKYTNDQGFVQKNLWDALKSIVEHHLKGTQFDIKVDEEGLLTHGPQLTWMDAKVGERPVTPREGKAVEIQALWYNALRIMEALAHRFGERGLAADYSQLASKAKNAFRKRFWNGEKRCLYDVIYGEHPDPSLRPNQIIAAYLDFRMLKPVEERRVVELIWDNLWGVYGIRTLDSADPRHIGTYQGDFRRRNEAYHNGTAWAWLLGPFVTSFVRVNEYDPHKRRDAYEYFLRPLFEEEMSRRGLGVVSEIFDGDWPHRPRGCISQAWSLAEPFRAYVEDILLKRPPFEGDLTSGMR